MSFPRPPQCCFCAVCEEPPQVLRVAFSGVAACPTGLCSDYNDFNGTHEIPHHQGCVWAANGPGIYNPGVKYQIDTLPACNLFLVEVTLSRVNDEVTVASMPRRVRPPMAAGKRPSRPPASTAAVSVRWTGKVFRPANRPFTSISRRPPAASAESSGVSRRDHLESPRTNPSTEEPIMSCACNCTCQCVTYFCLECESRLPQSLQGRLGGLSLFRADGLRSTNSQPLFADHL